MNDNTIHDLFELALRLEHHRLEQRDHVLIHREQRVRDGPRRHQDPLWRKESLSGAKNASHDEKPTFNWRSKGF